ncbi:hypothetical protein L596_022266 [Steinernema carpocapsae]|uniref:Uncharacterized protein n=1 Tax=Steinernema carpocapsae TaxID=34508 RepID=A0A4V6A073_STECR|nr:hypothetical protein L596_022266 [Steinernema carpocapsae]
MGGDSLRTLIKRDPRGDRPAFESVTMAFSSATVYPNLRRRFLFGERPESAYQEVLLPEQEERPSPRRRHPRRPLRASRRQQIRASSRTWGKAKNECYWAPDFRRCLPGNKTGKHNVVVDIEDGLKRGFLRAGHRQIPRGDPRRVLLPRYHRRQS